MSEGAGGGNWLGYDTPLYRDWLFLFAFVFSATGGVLRLIRGDDWFVTLSSVCSGVLIIGLVIGSIREVIRGFREP